VKHSTHKVNPSNSRKKSHLLMYTRLTNQMAYVLDNNWNVAGIALDTNLAGGHVSSRLTRKFIRRGALRAPGFHA